MPAPSEVQILTVRHSPYFTAQGTLAQQKLITYNVGVLGPFTLAVPIDSDTPEYINAQLQAQVDALKAINAIR